MSNDDDGSILDTLDSVVPITKFDAFPKLPSTYKARSKGRGFLTILVAVIAFLLILNDLGDYLWGWPDTEFSIDQNEQSFMDINVDMVVNMPCRYLSVDLRDMLGDRLFLSHELSLDGAQFDIGQATAFQAHSPALSAPQAIAQSRKSRGFLAALSRSNPTTPGPRHKHHSGDHACRISGSLLSKKVTGNMHVTVVGHGYQSMEFVDYARINLSHIITEFSFGPFFPEMTQPLDNTYELTHSNNIVYQYYLHIVPTTYIAPRSQPLHTNQYSVTHYVQHVEPGLRAPGIFFKFEVEPLQLTIFQRTTTLTQLLIRCVGVIGGVFVCASYAVRVMYRAVDVATAPRASQGTIAVASGVKIGLRDRWTGSTLRVRPSAAGSAGGSPGPIYHDLSGYGYPSTAGPPPAPPPGPPRPPGSINGSPRAGGVTLQPWATTLGSPDLQSARLIQTAATRGSPGPYTPGWTTPSYDHYPPTPDPARASPHLASSLFGVEQGGSPSPSPVIVGKTLLGVPPPLRSRTPRED